LITHVALTEKLHYFFDVLCAKAKPKKLKNKEKEMLCKSKRMRRLIVVQPPQA
jgi:hypothetical protein